MAIHCEKLKLFIYDVPPEIIDTIAHIYPKDGNQGTKWVKVITEKVEITLFEESKQSTPREVK